VSEPAVIPAAPAAPAAAPAFPFDTLSIRPWPDPVIDRLGHDPRSPYVERFWLGILGPSTTWLLRRFAAGLDEHPGGFDLDLAETARALGLGDKFGRNSPFIRALYRCCQFHLASAHGSTLEVRRRVPPLNRQQVARLSPRLQQAHQAWVDDAGRQTPEQLRQRARRLALSLFELGEDVESTERQLHRWRFHPALAREATAWALQRHREAHAATVDPA
jgi:hypothetical protein